MRFKRRISVLITLVSLALLAGCHHEQPSPKETDAVAVGNGRVESVFDKSVPEMTNASRALLVGQKLVLVQYVSGAKVGRVVAYTPNSQRIEIDVRTNENGSRVIITTDGNAGDQISMQLLDRLRKGK